MKSKCVSSAVQGLEPEELWGFFSQLSSIPRPSFQEERCVRSTPWFPPLVYMVYTSRSILHCTWSRRVLEWLKQFADERSLEHSQDSQGNLVIRHPGTMEGVDAPPVIIQGHVDMVTEKNAESSHDFMRDPIALIRDGDWLRADGTTLGADNGIGVCAALSVLNVPRDSTDVLLPPIEALFTVAEEVGLVGAFNLDGSLLSGKVLLNLDTEDWPDIFIGCAGGGDSILTLSMDTMPAGEEDVFQVRITGLLGGHSGMDIGLDRGNAVKVAADLFVRIRDTIPGARLVSLVGGDKRNAIPREAMVSVSVPTEQRGDLERVCREYEEEFLREFGVKEALKIECNLFQGEARVLAPDDGDGLISLLIALPHGPLKHSHQISGLVETSSNLASVKSNLSGEKVVYTIQTSTRSSINSALSRVRRSIKIIGESLGARVEQPPAYPGWTPDPDNDAVKLARRAITKVLGGREPELRAIHAGLECGILGERIPGVQCVSYGPTIRGAHSPEERILIDTVQPFWEATLELLGELAKRRA